MMPWCKAGALRFFTFYLLKLYLLILLDCSSGNSTNQVINHKLDFDRPRVPVETSFLRY